MPGILLIKPCLEIFVFLAAVVCISLCSQFPRFYSFSLHAWRVFVWATLADGVLTVLLFPTSSSIGLLFAMLLFGLLVVPLTSAVCTCPHCHSRLFWRMLFIHACLRCGHAFY